MSPTRPLLLLLASLLAGCGTAQPLRPASSATQARVSELTRHRCAPQIAQAVQSLDIDPASIRQILVKANEPQIGGASPTSYDAFVLVGEGRSRIVNLDFACQAVGAADEGGANNLVRFTR